MFYAHIILKLGKAHVRAGSTLRYVGTRKVSDIRQRSDTPKFHKLRSIIYVINIDNHNITG